MTFEQKLVWIKGWCKRRNTWFSIGAHPDLEIGWSVYVSNGREEWPSVDVRGASPAEALDACIKKMLEIDKETNDE